MAQEERPSAANVADACLRLGVDYAAIPDLVPVVPGAILTGPALPVRHYGSVDIFLERLEGGEPGQVLVVDNRGRDDEGCVGDLTAIEVQAAGLAGLVVWGRHRDSADLRRIGLPLFSLGACASGPRRLDPREPEAMASALVGGRGVTAEDFIVADDDGVIVLPRADAERCLAEAAAIRRVEADQAGKVRAGLRLREQLDVPGFIAARDEDPELTFRAHLARRGAAIET